ncbi:MAG: hypothetical protein JOY54_06195 [Acidobacteriaceae bacterium]|nr:hypothetical protein [Acidobacteriaceae bacterium]
MTARQIRRAQERREKKLARRAETQPSVSEAQLQANRANAQLSSGPKTEAGKAKSSLTAVKTGLTGQTVLLPDDDVAAYSALIAAFAAEWQPQTDQERRLVQSLADTEWRLLRIPALEAGIYAIGRIEAVEQFPAEEDQAVRRSLIDAHVFLGYRRQLNNLSIQENRLRRQREKDTAMLRELQRDRLARIAADESAKIKQSTPVQPVPNGFEFSTYPKFEEEYFGSGAANPGCSRLSGGSWAGIQPAAGS